MSVNKYQPHVLVLPEDRANREMARGFTLYSVVLNGKIQVLAEAGGWRLVVERLQKDHVTRMERFPGRFLVLLIDFDGQHARLDEIKAGVPGHLAGRVFILGVWTRPEALRQAVLDSYETIGMKMAQDCHQDTNTMWGHELLRHNAAELTLLWQHVRRILFSA